MMNHFKYINLILILFALILVIPKLNKLNSVVKKKAVIISKMRSNRTILEKSVQSCEVISEINNRKPIYDELQVDYVKTLDEKYWILKKELNDLNHKLMVLSSHTSMVLDKYKIFKDKVSTKIYLGMYQYPLIPCDSHSLKINGEEQPYKSHLSYKVSKRESIELEYRKYRVNYSKGSIDTLKKTRTINRNTLYNIR